MPRFPTEFSHLSAARTLELFASNSSGSTPGFVLISDVIGQILASDITGLGFALANTFAAVATSGAYADLTGKPTIPTLLSQLTNDPGFITASGTAANVSGTVAIANGGTGATTAAAARTALAVAPLASPPLTGTPTAPTAAGGTSTTQLATTAFVQAALSGLGGARTINVGLTATGTNQGTAFALTTDDSVFSTVAAGTGAILRTTNFQVVMNFGANAQAIYPPVGGTINGGAANAAVSIAAGGSAAFHTQDGVAFYAR